MGNSEENVALGSSVNIETQAIPLHRAILNARRERARHRVDRGEGYSANMSEKEIMHYVWDLSSRLTEDARQCLVQNRRLKKEAEKRDSDEWSLGAARFASCVRSLLIHPRVHSINVHDLNASNRKVRETKTRNSLVCWLVEKEGRFFIYHQRISDTYIFHNLSQNQIQTLTFTSICSRMDATQFGFRSGESDCAIGSASQEKLPRRSVATSTSMG